MTGSRAARHLPRRARDFPGGRAGRRDKGAARRRGRKGPASAARFSSNDVSGAYQTYLKAENDERLARVQLDRAQILFDKGAISKSALEQAEATETDAKADSTPPPNNCILSASTKTILPASSTSPRPSPASSPTSRSPPPPACKDCPVPIPSLSPISRYVWIVCDVYENDLDAVRVGDSADIHLNAYPNQLFKGRIDNILPVLDPNSSHRESAPGGEEPRPDAHRNVRHCHVLRQATGNARRRPRQRHSAPARPRVGLHAAGQRAISSAWKSSPATCLPGKQQEVVSGIKPGDQVVSNALDLQNTVEQ